jgi:hypothetical protein
MSEDDVAQKLAVHAGAGFGAGMLLNNLLGGNQTGGIVGSGAGALGETVMRRCDAACVSPAARAGRSAGATQCAAEEARYLDAARRAGAMTLQQLAATAHRVAASSGGPGRFAVF